MSIEVYPNNPYTCEYVVAFIKNIFCLSGMAKNVYVYSVIISAALFSLILLGITDTYAQNEKFRAKLDGNNEVPPVDTPAEGVINFKTKDDIMTWKMNVTGITDATALNIYQGMGTENGEPIVDLMKSSKHSDNPIGMTMRGNFTDSNLQGPMEGKSLEDLKDKMGSGNTYVNVHTTDHPDGMIRGQIKIKGTDDTTTASVNNTGTNTQ
ncbi:MAG: CHRD domain-containing protein [Nitrososphaeraceae archaeon]|nr:CHRD domain-containing protein [Nitrososphaeraceae archaeon]